MNIFSALLLCKINGVNMINMVDFLKIFLASRNTEVLIDINFCLKMDVPYTFLRGDHQ